MRVLQRLTTAALRRKAFLFVVFFMVGWVADRTGITPRCLQSPHGERPVDIVRVLDGDTVVDSCDNRLRIVGIDTPERDTPWGPAAADFTRAWLAAAPAELTVLHCKPAPEDRYGRRLVRLHRGDGHDLSADLLAAGWAYPLHMAPCGTPWQADDLQAFRDAKAARRGLWRNWDARPRDVRTALAERGWLRVRGEVSTISPRGEDTALRLRGGRGLSVTLSGEAARADLQVGDVIIVEGWIGPRSPARMRVRDSDAIHKVAISSARRRGSAGRGPTH
jgi:endonuclease YncB( thermonuclease family)